MAPLGREGRGKVPTVRTWAQFLLRDQPPAAERVSDSLRRPFGQYWSGLLDSEGREKLAAQSFRAGLVAERRGRKALTLWGRLRLGEGPRRVRIERSVRGRRWRTLLTLVADGREAFSRPGRYVKRARYRLVHQAADGSEVAGIPVDVVGRVPKKQKKRLRHPSRRVPQPR